MIPSRFTAIALCIIPSFAAAQAGRDALIPRELVEALINVSSYGNSRVEVLVGVLPPALEPKVKLPAGAKVLGGMNFQEGATGVVLVDGTLSGVASDFHRSLLAQGWEVPVDDPMSFMRSEFIDPPSNDRRIVTNGRPEMYCGRAGTLNVRYQPSGFDRTQITLGTTGVNQCAVMRDQMFQSRAIMGGGAEPKRPTLVNHPAARSSQGACTQYNLGMGDRKTDLGSQLPASDILGHYAKQLADSGWAQVGTTIAAVFQKRDTSGVLYEYQMVVHAPSNGAGCRSVRTDLNGSGR